MTAIEQWQAFRRRHLERDFGSEGHRRIRMTVMTAGRAVVSYDIDHLWRRTADTCRSLLFVRDPPGLRHTFIRMMERGLSESVALELKLMTASHILKIAPERYSQQVLGTDFNYEDLRFWRPLPVVGQAVSGSDDDGSTLFEFERPVGGARGERLAGRSDGEILRYWAGESIEQRCWSVDRWMGLRPPSAKVIRLSRLAGRFESRMDMVDLNRSPCLADEMFEPDTLADRLIDMLRSLSRNPMIGDSGCR